MNINNDNYLLKQLAQQERIVSQLIEIVATTNHKVKQLEQQMERINHTYRMRNK